MATTKVDTFLSPKVRRVKWTSTANETFASTHLADLETVAIQVTGTFDGATATVGVSDDGTNYVGVPSGAVTFAAAGLKHLPLEYRAAWLRLVTTGGGASVDLTVTLIGRVALRRS